MNKYFVRVSYGDESIYILADEIFMGDELQFVKDRKTIACFKEWKYWMQVFE